MTDKELQKLGRRELLQMLLEQAKEAERLGALLKETEEKCRELEDNYERLRGASTRRTPRSTTCGSPSRRSGRSGRWTWRTWVPSRRPR